MKSIKHRLNIQNILVYGLYVLLLFIIVSSIFYLRYYTYDLTKKLDDITPYIKSEDWEKSQDMFNNFESIHRNRFKNLSLIINHESIDDVLISMNDLSTNIKFKNKYLSLIKIQKLKSQIHNIYDSQIPKLQNIL